MDNNPNYAADVARKLTAEEVPVWVRRHTHEVTPACVSEMLAIRLRNAELRLADLERCAGAVKPSKRKGRK